MYVLPGRFWPTIQKGCYLKDDEPSFSAAETLLHELFHVSSLTLLAYSERIRDWKVNVPDIGAQEAYGAFYAMHMKDWAMEGKKPLQNADNYVYTVWELYYKKRYGLGDWQDPPERATDAAHDPCRP